MEYAIQFVGVIGTIGLLWLTLQFLRRYRPASQSGPRVWVKQRINIASGCQLVVVDWDGREMLIATGSQACTVVASKTANEVQVRREVSGAWAH